MGELPKSNNPIDYKKLSELFTPRTERKLTNCKICKCRKLCTFDICNKRKKERKCPDNECDLLKGTVLINLPSYCFNKNESPVKCPLLRKKQGQ